MRPTADPSGEGRHVAGSRRAAPSSKVRLTIRDNGAGIAPGASMGIGMTAMRERVGGLGGTASIDSAPGQGTTVSMVVPLDPRKGEVAAETKAMEGRVK